MGSWQLGLGLRWLKQVDGEVGQAGEAGKHTFSSHLDFSLLF